MQIMYKKQQMHVSPGDEVVLHWNSARESTNIEAMGEWWEKFAFKHFHILAVFLTDDQNVLV